MNGVFESSKNGKKTKRMKWKVTMKQVNVTDTLLKMDVEVDGNKRSTDLMIHKNKNNTINIDGYVVKNKVRKPVSMKNLKITELEMKKISNSVMKL